MFNAYIGGGKHGFHTDQKCKGSLEFCEFEKETSDEGVKFRCNGCNETAFGLKFNVLKSEEIENNRNAFRYYFSK